MALRSPWSSAVLESPIALMCRLEPLDNKALLLCCGPLEQHLRAIEQAWGVTIQRQNDVCSIQAPTLALAERTRDFLLARYQRCSDVLAEHGSTEQLSEEFELSLRAATAIDTLPKDAVLGYAKTPKEGSSKRQLLRTAGQRRYWSAMESNDVVFGIGVAGTGKTYLAVAKAVEALLSQEVSRIVLVRPAVEAGERLGFLPGDMAQKVDPYLRPLFDALHEHLGGAERLQKAMERQQIEIAPLAYMRGRTLQQAFVVLDEAQNTTPEQMKMFLTRLGWGSKMVITGDVTQIDLPRHQRSGLVEAQTYLKEIEGLAFCTFEAADVVRHPLVQRIVEAYDKKGEGESKDAK
jgi:phosphate starvation-inducible protein PhoH and related proteins